MRRDDERLADIMEAAEKIAVWAAKGLAAFDASRRRVILSDPHDSEAGQANSARQDTATSACMGLRSA